MPRPLPAIDAPGYNPKYIEYTKGNNAAELIQNHSAEIMDFYTSLPAEKADYAYAPGKWTIKQVLQHVIDTERVFVYRLLRVARNDSTPLPGFDENHFAENAETNNRTVQSLKEELELLRKSTDIFISTLSEKQLSYAGTNNNFHVTANALMFLVYGHLLHHMFVTKERYL